MRNLAKNLIFDKEILGLIRDISLNYIDIGFNLEVYLSVKRSKSIFRKKTSLDLIHFKYLEGRWIPSLFIGKMVGRYILGDDSDRIPLKLVDDRYLSIHNVHKRDSMFYKIFLTNESDQVNKDLLGVKNQFEKLIELEYPEIDVEFDISIDIRH